MSLGGQWKSTPEKPLRPEARGSYWKLLTWRVRRSGQMERIWTPRVCQRKGCKDVFWEPDCGPPGGCLKRAVPKKAPWWRQVCLNGRKQEETSRHRSLRVKGWGWAVWGEISCLTFIEVLDEKCQLWCLSREPTNALQESQFWRSTKASESQLWHSANPECHFRPQ